MSTKSPQLPCQLADEDLDERARAWRALGPFVVRRESIEGGFRPVLDQPALKQLEAPVAAERSCCGWATWSIGSDGAQAVLA